MQRSTRLSNRFSPAQRLERVPAVGGIRSTRGWSALESELKHRRLILGRTAPALLTLQAASRLPPGGLSRARQPCQRLTNSSKLLLLMAHLLLPYTQLRYFKHITAPGCLMRRPMTTALTMAS